MARDLIDSDEQTFENREKLFAAQKRGFDLIERVFADGIAIRRICSQAMAGAYELAAGRAFQGRLVTGAGILMTANRYDEMTAMHMGEADDSEVKAVRELLGQDSYKKEAVEGLLNSVNILFPGVSIELSTGEKALVLKENPGDLLRPTVLCFANNKVLDLSRSENRKIEVKDILKTLDNRYIMKEIPPYQP